MKFDTIEINGQNYRVEFNWNAIVDFLESENLKLTDVDALDNLKPGQITALIYAGIKEGARLEDKTFDYSVKDLGAALNIQEIAAMLEIFKAQTAVNTPVKKKTKLNFLKK